MPLLFIVFAILFLLVVAVATMPLALLRRYRAGVMTRPARGWIAAINLAATSGSSMLLVVASAVSSIWIPKAFIWTGAGFLVGLALGLLGLVLTRWQISPRAINYTPPRLLILTITVVVIGRLLYGIWRMWTAWHSAPEGMTWIASSGAAGSMGAGAIVLGYYVMYWAGVLRRAREHRRLTRT